MANSKGYTPALMESGAIVLEIMADQVGLIKSSLDDDVTYHGIKCITS